MCNWSSGCGSSDSARCKSCGATLCKNCKRNLSTGVPPLQGNAAACGTCGNNY
ncbi:predicted protein [Naegleria gruberi]|uniref:Predicted protein n=1 Tax=Naegleria gruberi TaxID=5762 RepID=D2VI21_NAEGR|nr:uncharacterized protein NAEGRDRAFT_34235 [Naegleria gruberi]EFC43514.1 predicted protein [Naegleria gruberi]|eukprot:XP_002676258.1 predicted protein [Naegleria gruberi strain NEG-M]